MPEHVPTEPGSPGPGAIRRSLEETPLQAVDAIDVDAVPESQWKEAWKRLRTAPLFWVSAAIIVFLAVVIAFPGLFTERRPELQAAQRQLQPAT